MELLKKFSIPFVVFLTGACVLVIEIVAIRILSVYFGNTIFTVSSIISVILGALSAGYYVGGKLADRYPRQSLFYQLIAGSGFAVVGLYIVGLVTLPFFAYNFSVTEGPIIASVLLFFLQSFLLGMLSPFAVKLHAVQLNQAEPMQAGVGSVSGQIFFWSTLGSIFGSLLAGFFLIPRFGTDAIMLGTGFVLIILGLFGNLRVRPQTKLLSMVLVGMVVYPFLMVQSVTVPGAVHVKDSQYQKIIIQDTLYEGRPARFLLQDRNLSAAKFLNSDELVFEYTKYYELYKILHPNIKQALAIGGGAYSVPRALLHDLPQAHVDVVEIDPELYGLVKTYFELPENPRLRNVVEDGRRFLHDTNNTYDFIFSDAYASFYSVPSHMATQEFFTLAKEKLTNDGIFMANMIGSVEQKPQSFLLSEIKTFQSVFPNSYFFAVRSPTLEGLQNIIFVGLNQEKHIDFNAPEITKSQNPIIFNLPSKLIDVTALDLANHKILTDNFAPVDYLISKDFHWLQ